MSFTMLPPEVNSARMYAGPGSGSMRASAVIWEGLSADLHSIAETYESVVASLTSMQWLGASAAAMGTAVIPYTHWLTTTATQAKQTAIQAMTAATAFENAFAMTVPPVVIATNRAQLVFLIATNFFGQNTAAIASTELAYQEMWAQDSAAMTYYAAASAAASAMLPPFTSPQQDTNPEGLLAQNAAVARAAANDGNWLGNLLIEIGTFLLTFAPELSPIFIAAGEAINAIPFPSFLADDFTILDGILAVYATISATQNLFSMGTGVIGSEKDLGLLGTTTPAVGKSLEEGRNPVIASLSSIERTTTGAGLRAGLGEVSASFRSAGSIGQMSVPTSWSAPATTTNVKTFQATPLNTLDASNTATAGMPGLPGLSSSGAGRGDVVPRYGVKVTVMSRPLAGG
ncbi:PPE family protein [Mycobacterium uberis]|uniref:PPE family protein n=1 Tax=Mycobacterium uberis TaxID=2162698 RepID=A0A3E1HEZ6_9MYCO|nr:PPE family protein [Mycobacterium uberis]RFD25028.1 PPE family protein [Mycobacterium uberis]